jgi:hypothetical protein
MSLASAVGVAAAMPAQAATHTMTMSYTNGANPPTGLLDTTNDSDQGGFVNVGIPGGTTTNSAGTNRLMANYWNNNSTWANKPNGQQIVTFDDQTGAYHLSTYNASTYFPGNGRPGLACAAGATINDPCHWTPTNAHFPSDYPALYKGCHFTQCSVASGAPFPMTLNSLVSLQSAWNVTVPNAGVGTFDVAYDIWLDRGVQAAMPAGETSLNQNDGAEIMIWMDNHGYGANGATNSTPITPAGVKVGTFTDSQGAGYDVWINRQSGPPNWNIVTYVRQVGTTSLNIDTKQFIDDSLTYNTAAKPNISTQLQAACPAQPDDGTLAGECVSPSWWLTSVQTGFEIWDLPADGGAAEGGALGTNSFSVKPLSVLANTATGATGRFRNGNLPGIQWNDNFNIKYASCVGAGTGTYTVHPGNGATADFTGNLVETPPNSGIYVAASVGPLNPGHDGSTLSVSIPCPGGADTQTNPVFIDPSGHVETTNGLPVQNATVTLLRSTSGTAAGPYQNAPAADITPTTNPESTDATGAFRWDVLAGFYEVQATAPGCNTVTTSPLPVPPPQVDLLLRLTCGAGATGVVLPGTNGTVNTGLPVSVVVRPPGITQFGYCADITVTNNTSAPVTWNVSFPVPGGQHINQQWNMVLTQVGGQATNVHADPNNPWNAVLQPGQSTTSTGFCAVP